MPEYAVVRNLSGYAAFSSVSEQEYCTWISSTSAALLKSTRYSNVLDPFGLEGEEAEIRGCVTASQKTNLAH